MLKTTPFTFLILFAFGSSLGLSAQGVDDLMNQVHMQSEQFEMLSENIAELSDHLLLSDNELTTKGEELSRLAEELETVLARTQELQTELENEMDTFIAGCQKLCEEKCPESEKRFRKMENKVEPILERNVHAEWALGGIDNRYDEPYLLESFAKASKVALQTSRDLADLEMELAELSEGCN